MHVCYCVLVDTSSAREFRFAEDVSRDLRPRLVALAAVSLSARKENASFLGGGNRGQLLEQLGDRLVSCYDSHGASSLAPIM